MRGVEYPFFSSGIVASNRSGQNSYSRIEGMNITEGRARGGNELRKTTVWEMHPKFAFFNVSSH